MKFCSHCGEEVKDEAVICSHCGCQVGSVVNQPVDEGSKGLGFVMGFFLGLIGLIIGLCLNQPLTKKGAISGFITSLIIGVVGIIIYVVFIFVVVQQSGGFY